MFTYELRFLDSKEKLRAAALRKVKTVTGERKPPEPNSNKTERVNNHDSVSQSELHTSFLPYSY